MGTLNSNLNEHNYYVNSIMEGFKLIGQSALLYQVDTSDRTLYYEPDNTYKPPVGISLVFESNPQPILKKYNWYTEGEDTPYIVHIVAMDDEGNPIEIQENMKIVIKSSLGLKTQRVFDVSRVYANHIDPLTFLCKLTPHRFKIDLDDTKNLCQRTVLYLFPSQWPVVLSETSPQTLNLKSDM